MAASTSTFFVEREPFFAALGRLLEASTEAALTAQADVVARTDALHAEALVAAAQHSQEGDHMQDVRFITSTIERYQEQPHLLDPHLPGLIAPIMARARSTLRAWYAAVHAAACASTDAELGAAFQFQVYHNPYLHRLFSIVYIACKTRGYKAIIRLFPHEVADLEPVLHCLMCQDASRHDIWETRYVLLLWLSILVLVPFSLATIDSSMGGAGRSASRGLIASVLRVGKMYLADPGAVRDAAAVCLSRLLTRPDMDDVRLEAFLLWATDVLSLCGSPPPVSSVRIGSTTASVPSSVTDADAELARTLLEEAGLTLTPAVRVFLTAGVLHALVEISKHGDRDVLREHLSDAFSRVVAITDAEYITSGGGGSGTTGLRTSPLLRKLVVKLASRTGLAHLPPRVVAWRYDRGHRSLLDNLSQAGVAAAAAKAAEIRAHAPVALPTSASTTEGEDVEDADVPMQMDDIIDMLLSGLKDTDTVVRWSAAKGVGRVTGRLPHYLADQVVAAVISLLDATDSDAAWHGVCLCLAELARRGLLLPPRLVQVVPLVLRALAFDQRKGAHSVGAHVRDAACYVCWAFARAYAPTHMRTHVRALAQGMLITACFDREINCRRAASAAFQENVGRQGSDAFPHGIDILTCADYFSLGNRSQAYSSVAPRVAAWPEYRYAMLEHLLHVKACHWDRTVRAHAAQALAHSAHLDQGWSVEVGLAYLIPACVHTDLHTRHGAIMCVGEMVLALAAVPCRVPPSVLDDVRNIVVKAEKARAYTGRGGELVRAAMCRLIECQCLAGHTISRKAALRMLTTLDDCIRHPNENIQRGAVSALRNLSAHALHEADAATLDRLPRTYISKLRTDDNPAVRRGCALALGALPRSLLCAVDAGGNHVCLDAVIHALTQASKQEKQASRRDAETRRNACVAIADMCVTVGFGTRDVHHVSSTLPGAPQVNACPDVTGLEYTRVEALPGLTPAQFALVCSSLCACTHDYACDNRGDVGSWVRAAAVAALERVLMLAIATSAHTKAAHAALNTVRAASNMTHELFNMCVRASTPSVAVHTPWSASPARDGGSMLTRVDAHLFVTARPRMTSNGVMCGACVDTPYGRGVLESITACGAIAHVRYLDNSRGRTYFPYGVGIIHTSRVFNASSRACQHGEATHADVYIVHVREDVLSDAFLPAHRVGDVISAYLRIMCEKLDALRGCVGDALTRLLHVHEVCDVPAVPGVQHRAELERAFPAVYARMHTATEGEDDAHVAGEDDAGDDGGLADLSTAYTHTDIQWHLPHCALPRVVPLLSMPEYSASICEGVVTSVGGLSESVVKAAATALTHWASDRRAANDANALLAVLQHILSLCKPRAKQEWDVLVDTPAPTSSGTSLYVPLSAGGASAGGHDPHMARWFREILGSSGGASTRNTSSGMADSDTKIDARLVTPALRTLETLLACGAYGGILTTRIVTSDAGVRVQEVGTDVVRTCMARVATARDDALRVMCAASVLIQVLSWQQPVATQAMHALLDLLCHPYPRVRKVVAEKMYVRLLTLDTTTFAGADVDAASVVVSETPWDGEMHDAIPARDRLYALLGVPMPPSRSGVDAAVFSSAARALVAERAAEREEDQSYGSLVREAGY